MDMGTGTVSALHGAGLGLGSGSDLVLGGGGVTTSMFLMILPALQQSLQESLSVSKGPDTTTLSFSYTIFSMTKSPRSASSLNATEDLLDLAAAAAALQVHRDDQRRHRSLSSHRSFTRQ
uniref:Uncharacterized protein n=1 Tax=Arundo donax TaxID=35708 RepID=A0A0A9S6U4_ARUDO